MLKPPPVSVFPLFESSPNYYIINLNTNPTFIKFLCHHKETKLVVSRISLNISYIRFCVEQNLDQYKWLNYKGSLIVYFI